MIAPATPRCSADQLPLLPLLLLARYSAVGLNPAESVNPSEELEMSLRARDSTSGMPTIVEQSGLGASCQKHHVAAVRRNTGSPLGSTTPGHKPVLSRLNLHHEVRNDNQHT